MSQFASPLMMSSGTNVSTVVEEVAAVEAAVVAVEVEADAVAVDVAVDVVAADEVEADVVVEAVGAVVAGAVVSAGASPSSHTALKLIPIPGTAPGTLYSSPIW